MRYGRSWRRLAAALALLAVLAAGCARPAADASAAGLLFDPPQGYEVERGKAGAAQAFILAGGAAAAALAWTDAGDEPPNAKAVIDTLLRRRGLEPGGYRPPEILTMEDRTAADRPANYLEMRLPADGSGPAQHVRVLFFSGDSATYFVALLTDETRRDDPAVVSAWDGFTSSLRWQQESAQ